MPGNAVYRPLGRSGNGEGGEDGNGRGRAAVGSNDTFQTLLQLFRLYAGTGILAFPYAVKCGGLIAAPSFLVIIGALNNYTLRMLVHCKRRVTQDLVGPTPQTSLDDLAYAAFGVGGRRFCSIAMVVSLLGLCAGYLIFVGNTLRSSFDSPSWSTMTFLGLDINVCTILATVVTVPLTLIRNYNRVQWSGILGNVSLMAAVAAVAYHVVRHIDDPSVGTAAARGVKAIDVDGLPIFLGMVFFTFAIQSVVLSIESAAAEPSHFLTLLDWGGVIGIFIYIVFGCLAYFSFGSATSQIAFHMLVTRHNFVDIRVVEVLFCLSMVLLYPMQLLPVVQIFERWLGISAGIPKGGRSGVNEGQTLHVVSEMEGGDEADLVEDEKVCAGPGCCRKNTLRIALTIFTGTLAVLFGDVFSQLLSIVGALGFSLLSFILPPLIYLRIFGRELSVIDGAVTVLIVVIGVGGMILSTWIDAKAIIHYFEGHTADPC